MHGVVQVSSKLPGGAHKGELTTVGHLQVRWGCLGGGGLCSAAAYMARGGGWRLLFLWQHGR